MKPDDTPSPTDDQEANNAASAGCMARLVRLLVRHLYRAQYDRRCDEMDSFAERDLDAFIEETKLEIKRLKSCVFIDQVTDPKSALFDGLYAIEARHRNKNKDLDDWRFVAAFASREDAYNFHGRYHQHTCARVVPPQIRIFQSNAKRIRATD